MTELERWVYTLYGKSFDGESEIFKCLATTDTEAELLATRAGLKDFSIFDKSPLPESASLETAVDEVFENPILGETWLPLLMTLSVLSETHKNVAEFNHVSTVARKFGYAPEGSPYFQWLISEDGSTHCELAGNLSLSPRLSDDQLNLLGRLGWSIPSENSADSSLDTYEGLFPNPYRNFPVEMHPIQVFSEVIQALILVHEIEVDDFFVFKHPFSIEEVLSLNWLVQTLPEAENSRPLFHLPQGAAKWRLQILEARIQKLGFAMPPIVAKRLIKEHQVASSRPSTPEDALKYLFRTYQDDDENFREFVERRSGMISPKSPKAYRYEAYFESELHSSGVCVPEDRRRIRKNLGEFFSIDFFPLDSPPENLRPIRMDARGGKYFNYRGISAPNLGSELIVSGSSQSWDLGRVVDLILRSALHPETPSEIPLVKPQGPYLKLPVPLVVVKAKEFVQAIVGAIQIDENIIRLYSTFPKHFDIYLEAAGSLAESLSDLGPPRELDSNHGKLTLRELREEDGYWLSKFKMPLDANVMASMVHQLDLCAFWDEHELGPAERLDPAPVEDLQAHVGGGKADSIQLVYVSGGSTHIREGGCWVDVSPLDAILEFDRKIPISPSLGEVCVERFDSGTLTVTALERGLS